MVNARNVRQLGVAVLLCALSGASAAPNLLIIQTDEHNFRTLGCYGGTVLKTPNIDWLAKNGAVCTSFYATTPVCSPSRASFMTGRYPQHTDVITNNIPMRGDLVTFAQVLKRNGYATGYAGKWHLDGTAKPGWAPKRKFGFDDNRFMFNRGHWKKFEDTPKGPRVAARKNGKPTYAVDGADAKSFSTDWLTDKAIGFIKQNKGKPWCYMVALPDPHGPNTVRKPYDTMFAGRKLPIPATLHKSPAQTPAWAMMERKINPAVLSRLMAPYYGMVRCIDDNVGRLLDTLRAQGELDNTVIVFTSDHGDLCGEHGRLNKGVPYEGSARIPFVIYYKGRIRAGRRVGEALSCIDFMPTVLALMDVKSDVKVDGRDASALIAGDALTDWNDLAFLRGTGEQGWLCAVSDDLKLVYSGKDKPWLFDLKRDENEVNNYFNDPKYQDHVKRMTRALLAYAEQQKDTSIQNAQIKRQVEAALK